MASARLVNISKRFGKSFYALRDVSFEIKDREVLTILGPSGCGKSTLLRMVAGLDHPTAGEVWIGGKLVNGLAPRFRDVAMVFQSYALYPHMTCYENLALNLMLKKVPRAEIERRVQETARWLDIQNLLHKKPRELSGGERQRVAVGRCLIRNPQLFLFDEPLSNLDAILREKVRHELKDLFVRINATVIYVTHDQIEAMTLADRIVILNGGTVQQIGSPEAVYHRPQNVFVAGFIGSPAMNLFAANLQRGTFRLGTQTISTGLDISGPAKIGIRPEAIKIGRGLPATVTLVENLGSRFLIGARIDSISLMVLSDEKPLSGSIQIQIDPGDIHVFDGNSGENLRYPCDRRTADPQL